MASAAAAARKKKKRDRRWINLEFFFPASRSCAFHGTAFSRNSEACEDEDDHESQRGRRSGRASSNRCRRKNASPESDIFIGTRIPSAIITSVKIGAHVRKIKT